MTRSIFLMCVVGSFGLLGGSASAAAVGEKAPAVEPSEWLNAKGTVSWASLRGHLILVEKWATWCGPCRESIPHLNKLHDEFGKKGLAIIGVSDEAVGTIKPFAEKMDMRYLIAVGGAPEYKTDGIPHAWLVSPQGTILWTGHPASLTDGLIEENLKSVRLTPTFKLPKDLASAQKLLDGGKYASGLKELEQKIKSSKSEETVKVAKEAVEEVKKYGQEKLATAQELAKQKDYADALQALTQLEKGFSGHPVGDEAKKLRSKWMSDKDVKLELAAADQLEQAKELIRQKKYKPAGAILTSLVDSSKYKSTAAREKAQKELSRIRPLM